MFSRAAALLRPFAVPLAIASVAAVIFAVRIHDEMEDFEVYRRAGNRAVNAETLYRPDDGHYQYKYLPAFAFAMVPFARAADPVARVIWYALSVGLLVALVRWSVRALPERRVSEKALIWLAILFLGKFYGRELNLGQSNILLATVLVGGLLAAQIEAKVAAGVLVGIGVFVKPYAVVLAPWLLLTTGLPGLLAFGITVGLGLFAPALVYGWQGNLHEILGWYRTVTDTIAPNLTNPENISFAAMWTKWIGAGPLAMKLATATSALCLLVAAGVMALRRRVSEPAYLEFGLLMLLVPVVSPQGWDYVLLLATPAFLCVVDRWRDMSIPWRIVTAASIGGMSFTIFDLIGRTLYVQAMRVNVISVCVMMMIATLAHLRVKALA